jgi:hypothetical protein
MSKEDDLTPFVPLSLKGEGGRKGEEGLRPSSSPVSLTPLSREEGGEFKERQSPSYAHPLPLASGIQVFKRA